MAKVSIDEEYLDVLEATKERSRAMEAAVLHVEALERKGGGQ